MCDRRLILSVARDKSNEVTQALDKASIRHEVICQATDCSKAPACRWLGTDDLNSTGLMAAAIMDAIETLEQTRHAFRSKQLGHLRRRLETLLSSLPEA